MSGEVKATERKPPTTEPKKPRKVAEPTVRCAYCSRGVRGQARKRALHFGGDAFCSRCEREKRDGL